jgi:hypothetical protein
MRRENESKEITNVLILMAQPRGTFGHAPGRKARSAVGQETLAHLAELAKAFPPGAAAGSRYPERQLVPMDSEKAP